MVNTKEKIKNIEVINLIGKKVLTTTSAKINTANLSKGTYITLINLSDGRVVDNKIIIE
jgi:hypothetical protein